MQSLRRFLGGQTTPPPRVGTADAFIISNGQVVNVDSALRTDYTRALLTGREYYTSLLGYGQGLDNYTLAELYTVGVTAFICTKTRGRLVAGLPLKVNAVGVSEQDTIAHAFLETAGDLFYKIEQSLSLWGKCFLLKKRNFMGLPSQLEWLSPLIVTPVIDSNVGITSYRVQGLGVVALGDMVYLHYFNPLDQTDGISPYEVAFKAIQTESNVNQHALSFFQNSARPDILLKTTSTLAPDDIKKYVSQWKANFKGAENAYRVGILPSGEWEVVPLNANPVDLAMSETIAQSQAQTIAAFELNPIIVGLGQASDPLSAINTYNAAWENAINYWAIPEMNFILSGLNEWLLEFEDIYNATLAIEIDMAAVSANSKTNVERANTAIALQTAQTFSTNEAREYLGKAPEPTLIPRSRDYMAEYNTGLITRYEARRHMGLSADPVLDDKYIYELDPRQSGVTANPYLLASGIAPIASNTQPAPLPPAQLTQPNPALPIIRRLVEDRRNLYPAPMPPVETPPAIIESETVSPALAELRAWRQKQRKAEKEARTKGKHSSPVKFTTTELPTAIVAIIRSGLERGLHYGTVFDTAQEYLRNGDDIPDEPFGITPDEFEAYWRDLDALQGDISQAWLEYMLAVSQDVLQAIGDNPDPALELGPLFAQHHETFLQSLVGDSDNLGTLAQVMLAGMAKGNDILNGESPAESPITRQGWLGANQEALDFARQYGLDLIRGLDQTTLNAIRKALEDALANNWTPQQLQLELEKILISSPNVVKDEVLNRARRISETELARAYNAGAEKRWQDAGVTKAKWQTVRDALVCKICRRLHGQEYDLATGIYSPDLGQYIKGGVAHVSCRCFSRPVASSIDREANLAYIING